MQISIYRLYEFFESAQFQREVENALKEAGVVTVAVLQDDDKVLKAALLIHDIMPESFRLIIGVTLGKEGFIDFIFRIRDKLVAKGRLDLSWLDLGQIKMLLLAELTEKDCSNWLWVFKGQLQDGRNMIFEFPGPARPRGDAPFSACYIVGRSAEQCHIVIPDQRISRKHAELVYFPEKGLCVRDLGSTNGTTVDGKPVGDAYKTLEPGSEIVLGQLRLSVSVVR